MLFRSRSEVQGLEWREEDVEKAFQPDSDLLINAFTDEDDEDRGLVDFAIHDINGIINSITFWTEYAHDVRIVRMNKGYIYEQQQ